MRAFVYRLLGFFAILLFLIGTFVAMLPMLASTEWGRKQVLSLVNRSIPGKIEIRTLSLNWNSGQIIEGFLLKDPQGHSVLQFEKLSTEASLWKLLRKSTHLGFTQIVDLNAAIQTNEIGSTNLHTALGLDQKTTTAAHLFPTSTILSDVNVDLHLFSNNHPLSAVVKGMTRQDKLNGSFEINISVEALEAANWDDLKNDVQQYLSIEGSKNAKIQAHVVNFPVALIDRIGSLFNSSINGLFNALLGDRLNLSIEKEPSVNGLAFNLIAQTPLMQGNLKGKIANGLIAMNEPGSFHFNLTPEFVDSLSQEHFKLLNATTLKVIIHSLTFPLTILDSDASLDPCQFEFNTQWTFPKTELSLKNNPISLINLQALIHSPACSNRIECRIDGRAIQALEGFDFSIDSQLHKSDRLSSFVKEIFQNLHAKINIFNMPLHLIPQLQKHPEVMAIMGSTLDSQMTIDSTGRDSWEASLDIQTPKLMLKEAKFQLSNDLSLKNPVQIDLTLSKNCLSTAFNKDNLMMVNPCPVQIVLKSFRMNLSNPASGKFQLETLVPLVQFSHLMPLHNVIIQDTTLNIQGDHFSRLTSHIKGSLFVSKSESSPIASKVPLNFSLQSDWELGNDGRIEMPLGQLEIKSSILNAKIEGNYSSAGMFELTQLAQINFLIQPRIFKSLLQLLAIDAFGMINAAQLIPNLENNVSLKVVLYPFSADVKSFSTSKLNLKGALSIDQLRFEDSNGSHPYLEKIELPWELNAPANHFAADLKGLIYTSSRDKLSPFSSHIQLWLTQGQFDFKRSPAEIQMNFDGMPTSLLSTPFTSHDLTPILGPIIDLNFKTFVDPTHDKPGYLDLSMDSANFHIQGRFKLNHAATIYDEHKIPNFRLHVTPAGFQTIKQMMAYSDSLELAQPVTLSGHLSQLHFPIKGTLQQPPLLDFTISTTDVEWKNASALPFKIDGKVYSQNLFEDVLFSLNSTPSKLKLEGKLLQPLKPTGEFNDWSNIEVQTTIEGNALSSKALQSLLIGHQDISKKIQALFGEALDFRLSCRMRDMNGAITVSAAGPQAEVNFDGKLNQGVMTMNKPLEGSVNITPLFVQTFLTPSAPLLSSAVGSEKPIKFSFSNDQFYCPLFPFKLDQVKIGKGMLDLGKIRFRNEGELSSVLSFIHKIPDPYFTIWFTPLYFNLDKGLLTLKRLDFLVANSYTLASWGTINLIQQQGDLILALSAQSLQYAFGIQGLDQEYMLQIPLHTAKGKVDIDKKKVTGRITALIAQSQGGTKGKIFGSILDAALSNSEDSAPSPSTKHFPWKEEFIPPQGQNEKKTDNRDQPEAPTDAKKKKKKKHRQKDELDNPIKDIEQGAIQLIDNIFR